VKFENREEAGKQLASKLPQEFRGVSVVYGIALGGIVCSLPVANLLKVPLEPAFVSKLPLPWNQESAFGVVISDGNVILDEGLYRQVGLSYMDVQRIARAKLAEIKRHEQNIRFDNPIENLKDKEVLLVDDGLATGYTCLGAAKWLLGKKPAKVFIATPIAHHSAIELLESSGFKTFSLFTSTNKVFAVGSYYRDFEQVGDKIARTTIKENRDYLVSPD
jgi:putative phosphoribosyl transferase